MKGSPQSTFRILLLKLCENEFKRRNEDHSTNARQRCLGNVRFIAELGLLGLIPEKVLHDCIRELLSARQTRNRVASSSESAVNDSGKTDRRLVEETLATNMECLCEFMKIIGKFIDTPKGQNLVNQYFDRLKRIQSRAALAAANSEWTNGQIHDSFHGRSGDSCDGDGSVKSNGMKSSGDAVPLPARIRFMLDDLIDLRNNSWVPRHAGQRVETNKPRYLRDIRMEIFKDSGTLVAPTPAERLPSSRDVPGSGYNNHMNSSTSTNTNVPFLTGLAANGGSRGLRSTPFCPTSVDSNIVDAKSWIELARMGDELCRSGPGDLNVFSVGSGRSYASNGRPEHTFSNSNRRFVTSKSVSSNANNNHHSTGFGNSSKVFPFPDTWSNQRDRRDDATLDLGWVRGVHIPSKRPQIAMKNGSAVPNSSNLPPRMLRKMAMQSGSILDSDIVSPLSQADDIACFKSSGTHLLTSSKTSEDQMTYASESKSIQEFGTLMKSSSPNEFFEPSYMRQERASSLTVPFRGMSNTVSTPPRASAIQLKPKDSLAPVNVTSLRPDSLLAQSRTHTGRTDTSTAPSAIRNSLHTPLLHSDIPEIATDSKNAHHNTRLSATDESKKFVKRMLSAFEESKTREDMIAVLRSSEYSGNLTVELLATFVLRLCEEGASFPLALIDSSELAKLLIACTDFLGLDKKPNCPLALVWHQLLSKSLPSNCITFSKSKFASLSALLLWHGDLSLPDVTDPLQGGKHHPLFLLVLQQLTRLAECLPDLDGSSDSSSLGSRFSHNQTFEDRKIILARWFCESGTRMNQMMPDGSQLNEQLLEILEERNLAFFVPILRMSRDLAALASGDLSMSYTAAEEAKVSDDELMACSFSKCLQNHSSPEDRQSPEFVHALMPALYTYVYRTSQELPDSSPKSLMTRERVAWQSLLSVGLADLFTGSRERQLDALHALQLFWKSKEKPKGFLLRCFINLYQCDLIDETTFLEWKEEINPNYPAKGDALFEVNRWLTWLENAEEEEEEKEPVHDSKPILITDNEEEESKMPSPLYTEEDIHITYNVSESCPDQAIAAL